MLDMSYDYQKPELTYTLEQYIACKSDDNICFHNLSFVDRLGDIDVDTYNITADYIDEIRKDYCLQINLSLEELTKYKYRPKMLCYDIYKNTELSFIILIINDMCSVKEFNKKKIYMPKIDMLSELIKHLFNANRTSINRYNNKESTFD